MARLLLAMVTFVALPVAADELPLCYSASGLPPGLHYEMKVTASSGFFLSSKVFSRRKVLVRGGDEERQIEQRASNVLRWKFVAPAGGTVPEQTFSFQFPNTLDRNHIAFLTVDMTFEQIDRGRIATRHMLQTFPAFIRSSNPCITLTGSPDGSLKTSIVER